MDNKRFQMRFDPQTIRHLGLRMYSTLPPALAEIISNSYDADATYARIHLIEDNDKPVEIKVEDDGTGMTYDEINDRFLVIGRNRREADGDNPTEKFNRLPIGKKGLGKLALFGLAQTITVSTVKAGKKNVFVLDWEDLNSAGGDYFPKAAIINEDTAENDGTVVSMNNLKRKTAFDINSLANSLSRTFIFNPDFELTIIDPKGKTIEVDSKRKYDLIDVEFEWDLHNGDLIPVDSEYKSKLLGKLITALKPITPASGLRGVTLFSRGKLVNAPEFFSASTSSHFFQYLTGWISVDFIDELEDDVISTNRQSVDWEHPEMLKLREFLSELVSKVNTEWRNSRKEKRSVELTEKTGIDTESWLKTLPSDIKTYTMIIIDTLSREEALERFVPVIEALHNLVPEYPLLHWRYLHDDLRERVREYYENDQYGIAASQGVMIFCEKIRTLTGITEDGIDLVNRVFGSKPFQPLPKIQLNSLSTETEENIQIGQGHLARGAVTGFRNPIQHTPIDTAVPAIFSELDCLNILSLISYLFTRMDGAKVN